MLSCSRGKGRREEGREGKGGKRAVGGRHNLTLTPHDYLYLIAAVIWLGTGMRERHMLARMCFFLLFWMEFLPLNKWLPVAGIIGF